MERCFLVMLLLSGYPPTGHSLWLPHVLGTRLLVRQMVAAVQAHHGSVEAASAYLQLPSSVVRFVHRVLGRWERHGAIA